MKNALQGLLGGAPLVLVLAAAPAAAQDAEAPEAPKPQTASYYNYVGGSFGTIGGDSYDNRYGVPSLETETESGVALDVVWGAKTGNWRWEFGLDHRSHDVQTTETSIPSEYNGSIKATGLVVNAYYDFTVPGPFTPYVGIGVGAYNVTLDDGIIDDSGEGFQWQGIVGVAYQISDSVDVTLDGRYQLLGYDALVGSSDDSTTVNVEGFGARIGMRYRY